MRTRIIVLAVTILSFVGGNVSAKQYVTNYHGRQVVVHTNPLPVIMHRMVPPQYGRHVTLREVQQGKAVSPNQGLIGR